MNRRASVPALPPRNEGCAAAAGVVTVCARVEAVARMSSPSIRMSPRLIPILDKEVKGLLDPPRGGFWTGMHEQLSNEARRRTVAEVCEGAPDGVSLLRRIDVALWMHATQHRAQSSSV